jgi:predicted deacylase
VMLAGIPALTTELSSPYTPTPEVVYAGISGLRNVMRWNVGRRNGDDRWYKDR